MWHVFGKDTSIPLREHIKVSLWTTRHFLRWYKLWQVIGQRNPVLELSGHKFLSGIYYLQVLITNYTYCAWYMYNIQCVNKHQSFLLFPIYLQVSITSTMKPQWRWFTEIWSQKMVNILKYLILLNQQPYELGSRNSELLLKYL